MTRRSALAALTTMPEHDDDIIEKVTDRVERRLSDECGKLRVDDANLRADMNQGLGELRADMNQGLGELRADMNQGLGELRADMNQGLGELRADMNQGLGELRADMNQGLGELRAEIVERNAELLKWGLVFWTTQVGVVAALLTLMR